MAEVKPFRGVRPRNDLAHEVIAPPYDVLTLDEARDLAQNSNSFVRVTRPEVDLEEGSDPYSEACYAKAAENFRNVSEDGSFIRDRVPSFYCYGQTWGTHRQVCLLAGVPIEDYESGLIARHEFTRPDKEDDRTRHIEALNAQAGLVFLTYRARSGLQAVMEKVTEVAAEWTVNTPGGVRHEFWLVPQHLNEALIESFASVEKLYIADGHHRSAAAARVHASRQDLASAYFLAGLFPDDQLLVMAYNRVVADLNGRSVEGFLAEVSEVFAIAESDVKRPEARGSICMYIDGGWRTLSPRAEIVDYGDPVARLDVSILQDHLLSPILGIEDPRRSTRISFIGGIRGTEALERAVDQGAAVAFSLHPTGIDQLFDVADHGKTMPPKSTWFEPKLFEGVVVRMLDELEA
jgi:uncharacterized protein (DUF1015 family)